MIPHFKCARCNEKHLQSCHLYDARLHAMLLMRHPVILHLQVNAIIKTMVKSHSVRNEIEWRTSHFAWPPGGLITGPCKRAYRALLGLFELDSVLHGLLWKEPVIPVRLNSSTILIFRGNSERRWQLVALRHWGRQWTCEPVLLSTPFHGKRKKIYSSLPIQLWEGILNTGYI